MSDYEVWTYSVEILNDINGEYMTFEYDYDLGEDGSEGISPEDLHDEIISEIESDLRIIPRFVRSSHE